MLLRSPISPLLPAEQKPSRPPTSPIPGTEQTPPEGATGWAGAWAVAAPATAVVRAGAIPVAARAGAATAVAWAGNAAACAAAGRPSIAPTAPMTSKARPMGQARPVGWARRIRAWARAPRASNRTGRGGATWRDGRDKGDGVGISGSPEEMEADGGQQRGTAFRA